MIVKLFIIAMAGMAPVAEVEHPFEFDSISTCEEFGAQFMINAPYEEFQIYGDCRVEEEI